MGTMIAKFEVVIVDDFISSSLVIGHVTNIISQRVRRDVGNPLFMEQMINFTFRFDALEYDTPRVLQENSTPIMLIVSK